MNKLVIRHDDFDFRLSPAEYIQIHEEFIKRKLTETAVLQFAQFGRLANFPKELIVYMREAPYWDLQLHGWEHAHYDEMKYDFVVRDMAAAIYMCEDLFDITPTVWYPPWNCYSQEMDRAAEYLNLKIDRESNDIAKFIREVEAGTFDGHSVYFHAWEKNKSHYMPRMLDLAKEIVWT